MPRLGQLQTEAATSGGAEISEFLNLNIPTNVFIKTERFSNFEVGIAAPNFSTDGSFLSIAKKREVETLRDPAMTGVKLGSRPNYL